MELVVHDVTEQILERLPPKSLLRFKSISKQWKSTIESPFFQHKHLTDHRQKSKTPHLLMINTDDNVVPSTLESIMTLELKSSISHKIPIPWETNLYIICRNSCDGLVCLYDDYESVIIFNPATRWYRTLPPSTYQQKQRSGEFNLLGFGKDQINGLYKPVWLYNSSELGQNNNAVTTCEVFDFKINAWRFVEPSSPKRIRAWENPVYSKGLLYWLTEEDEEIRSVLSFDLHTETFEIVCKAPFEKYMTLYNVNDELCTSYQMEYSCVIWSLNLEEKTWKKIYFIDLHKICSLWKIYPRVVPLVFMEEKKKKKKFMLLDYYCSYGKKEGLILYDSQTTSVLAKGEFVDALCYFPSLISIL